MSLKQKILDLKKQKDAIILAHNYQRQEIQKIADYIGDSLGLSQKVSQLNKDLVVFCGVKFMAESAAILSPNKKILLPNKQSKCPMARMVTPKGLKELKEKNPKAAIVSYVNTTAKIKALSDICCTSSNAIKVTKSLDKQKIIFVPDKNLANYVNKRVEKQIIPWKGYCPTHDNITEQEVKKAKEKNPKAIVTAHPECKEEVLNQADHISSTGGMVDLAKETKKSKILVGTELDLVNRLNRENKDKEFIPLSQNAFCQNMKKITLKNTYEALKKEKFEINITTETRKKAKKALEKMLEV
ncbi:quinolinate synthase [archaeon SCG-AAA382B04]|nr:quinolinate synthase [archaeon SCG-AAA382B04]